MLPNGGGDGSAFECLTVAAMHEFNEQTPDALGVKYSCPGCANTFSSSPQYGLATARHLVMHDVSSPAKWLIYGKEY